MSLDPLRLSVIGLGKLGAPLLAVLAEKGFPVIGVDVDSRFVADLAAGRAPVQEPKLQELIDRNRDRICATNDYSLAIADSAVTFIIVPTPSGQDGRFSNEYILDCIARIGKALRMKSGYHLVVITSTVMPGSTGGEIKSTLENASGRQVGIDLGLCYNPEFIALGSVIRDMLQPDMVLIGESDEKAGDILQQIRRRTTESSPEIHRMNFVNAEITKIAINTYVTMKISYANMIGDFCDHITGADAEIVSDAVGADSRIGKKYLRSAIGYGGPCFPRDNRAFVALALQLDVACDLPEATDRINQHQLFRVTAAVKSAAPLGATVAILGLTYKPQTNVIEESQGMGLSKHLAEIGYAVTIYDPVATKAAHAALNFSIKPACSAESALSIADVVVIATAWPEFAELDWAAGLAAGRSRTIIDPWGVVATPKACAVRVIKLGRGDWRS